MLNKFAFVCLASLAALATANNAQGAFVVYDEFNSAAITATLWDDVGSSGYPTVAGGTATFDNPDYIRSNTAFPIGSTIRIIINSLAGNALVIGTNSQTNPALFPADDALYTRNDGGNAVYVDGTGSSAAPLPSAGTIDYVIGTTNLEIMDDGTSVFVTSRPAGFDEAQRIEIGVYTNGPAPSLVVETVLVQIPEPSSLALLGLGATALGVIVRSRRKASRSNVK